MLDSSQYFFGGWRRFFILGVWFMTIVSLVTMCNERVRVSENTEETEKVLAKINYQPKPNTHIHFFDNKQGTDNDFYIMKANSTGRYSDNVYFRDKCYKWRLEKFGDGHTQMISKEERGYVRFGLERGIAYLFIDTYPLTSHECRGLFDLADGEVNNLYGTSGGGIYQRTTYRLGPGGFTPVPKSIPTPSVPKQTNQRKQPTAEEQYRAQKREQWRQERRERRRLEREQRRARRNNEPMVLGPGRTLCQGPGCGGATLCQGPGCGPSYHQGR